MINLNIQKTYSNPYAKNSEMQINSTNLSNLKQDTVSFNGWFSKQPPKILVSQEAYQKICDWASKEQGGYAVMLMKHLKNMCENQIIGPNWDNASIGANYCELQYYDEVKVILEEALNTSTHEGLSSFLATYIKDLSKQQRKAARPKF